MSETLDEFLWRISIERQAISLNPGAALQAAIFRDGFVPVENEVRTTFDDGVSYALQAAEHLGTGERRVYYAAVPNWNDVRWSGDPARPPAGIRLTMPLSGPYLTPLLGSQHFNAPRLYASGPAQHEGLDFAPTAAGSLILAAAAGVVSAVRESDGYGKYVVLSHEGGRYFTWYAHADRIDVAVGQAVVEKQSLGLVGSTGNATGRHVHFNLQIPGAGLSGYVIPDVVDPTPYLDFTPIPLPASPPAAYTGPAVSGAFVRGVTQPASDWRWPQAKAVLDQTGLTPLFYTGGVNPAWYSDYKSDGFNIVRVIINPGFTDRDPLAIWQEIKPAIQSYWSLSQRDFILFNEPNLTSENLGKLWNNGSEFGSTFNAVCLLAKASFPGIRLWFPGCSPGFGAQHTFIEAARAAGAFENIYGIDEHVYTGIVDNAAAAVEELVNEVLDFRRRYALTRPLVIGEFSVNRPATREYKAEVYRGFYDRLAAVPGIQAAYSFTADWEPAPDANEEGWLRLGLHEIW